MSNVASLLFDDSAGTLCYRLKTETARAQVTSGVTIAVTVLDEAGVAAVTARVLSYDAAAKLHADDDETGAWTCTVSAAEIDTTGTYVATFTVTSAGVAVHKTVLRIPVVVDTGRRST